MDIIKTDFIIKYEQNGWHIAKTCWDLGITRRTYYNWLRDDEEFSNKMEEFHEALIDSAERCLLRAINNDETDAAKFVLRYKGRKRGYVESTDITTNGKDINTLNIIVKSEQEKKDLEDNI